MTLYDDIECKDRLRSCAYMCQGRGIYVYVMYIEIIHSCGYDLIHAVDYNLVISHNT